MKIAVVELEDSALPVPSKSLDTIPSPLITLPHPNLPPQNKVVSILNCAQCRENFNGNAFSSSALHGGEWSVSRPGHFTPGDGDCGIPGVGG